MPSNRCTLSQHLVAVICVIVVGVLMHTALTVGGIDGPSMARADTVYDQRVALPGTLR